MAANAIAQIREADVDRNFIQQRVETKKIQNTKQTNKKVKNDPTDIAWLPKLLQENCWSKRAQAEANTVTSSTVESK